MISIIVNGAHGKMGAMAVKTLREQSDFDVVAELGRGDNLEQALMTLKPDVVADWTNAHVIHDNMRIFLKTGIPTIVGTTGLSADDIAQYKKQADAQQQGMIIAPNFSIGSLLMMKYAEDAARYFSEVEIIEMHHTHKKDAPSGTALRTARLIAKRLDRNTETIPIHSVRLSGKMAHQQVIFGGIGETLTLQQDTLSRECFMPGFLLACRKVKQLNHCIEGLENILFA